jgi:hypothetical protein
MTYLSEVSGPRVVVNLLAELSVARQRVHDDHALLGLLEGLAVDNKGVLDLLVKSLVLEALLLHASAVKHIGLGEHLRGESVGLDEQLAARLEGRANLGGDGESSGRGELDLDVVVAEELAEGVDGAAVLEITGESDGETVDSTKLLTDGEEVEESLGRVLTGAVASVDDRAIRCLGGDISALVVGVAEHDGVGVLVKSTDGVVKILTLLGAGVRLVHDDGLTTKTLHGSIEGA